MVGLNCQKKKMLFCLEMLRKYLFFYILHMRENNTYFSSDASEVCKITILKNKMNSLESYQFVNEIMLIKQTNVPVLHCSHQNSTMSHFQKI